MDVRFSSYIAMTKNELGKLEKIFSTTNERSCCRLLSEYAEGSFERLAEASSVFGHGNLVSMADDGKNILRTFISGSEKHFPRELILKIDDILAGIEEEISQLKQETSYKTFNLSASADLSDFGGRRFRILIINNDSRLLEEMKNSLTEMNCIVFSVFDSSGVAENISAYNPDLIIVDLDFPGKSALDIIWFFRGRSGGSLLPIIGISAEPLVEDKLFWFSKGIDDYLVKPFDVRELAARVKAFLIRTDNLRETASKDELTGFYNRRVLKSKLAEEFARWERYHRPLSLIMLDIDDFKSLNDVYGHLVGDVVLKRLAEFLRAHIRNIDIPVRFGGEEFIIIFPETSIKDVNNILGRIYEDMKKWEIHIPELDHALKVTFCAGAAGCPEHGTTFEELISSADKALYTAKSREGKSSYLIMNGCDEQ